MPHQCRYIEAARIMQRAGVIADLNHLQTEVMKFVRGVGGDIAEALDYGRGVVPKDWKGLDWLAFDPLIKCRRQSDEFVKMPPWPTSITRVPGEFCF
jgi:hypothetical protein